MSLETLFSNPLPAIPPSRSLLSRFASPLAKRNRNITEFCVEPDHPWKSYGPGDIVRGHIVLTAAKGFDITHLVVCLHGFAKVYKNQVYPSDGPLFNENLDLRGGSQDVEYRGNGLVSLFQDEAVLCRDGFLKKGIYKFGFELVFPTKNLPSSIYVCQTPLLVTITNFSAVRARYHIVFHIGDTHPPHRNSSHNLLLPAANLSRLHRYRSLAEPEASCDFTGANLKTWARQGEVKTVVTGEKEGRGLTDTHFKEQHRLQHWRTASDVICPTAAEPCIQRNHSRQPAFW